MNRAERRRQERARIKGEKVLQVKRSDLEALYEDALKDVSKKDGAANAVRIADGAS